MRSYGSTEHPIHVSSELTGVLIAVPDLRKQRPGPSRSQRFHSANRSGRTLTDLRAMQKGAPTIRGFD